MANDIKKFRGQGQGQTLSRPKPRTQAQVFSEKKKLQKFFSGDLQKQSKKNKKGFQKHFSGDLQKKNVFQKIFPALHKILTIQKMTAVLKLRTGQFSRT